ncbi:MAG: twin-arginine translocase TatA/TatE family subunit [Vampirovibrionales bacterium]|nr:twin-arginine translocase TatA/TatE family subunit [Vampirovibrionales bacterium]
MTLLALPSLPPLLTGIHSYPLFLPNLGMGELAIIFVIILILFGPGKLPGVMKALGDGFRQFKDASSGDSQAPGAIKDVDAKKPE